MVRSGSPVVLFADFKAVLLGFGLASRGPPFFFCFVLIPTVSLFLVGSNVKISDRPDVLISCGPFLLVVSDLTVPVVVVVVEVGSSSTTYMHTTVHSTA